MNFDRRELRTILAALRYWQQQIEQHPSGLDPDRAEGLTHLETLTVDEIDELCERIAQERP